MWATAVPGLPRSHTAVELKDISGINASRGEFGLPRSFISAACIFRATTRTYTQQLYTATDKHSTFPPVATYT